MFQSFEATTQPSTCGPRLDAVRHNMRRARLDALLVPRTDANQGEYVTPGSERLRWLTSFTGSAGLAIITLDRARLLVDGRYVTQAQNQTDRHLVDITQIASTFDIEAHKCLTSDLAPGAIIGYDPWLHSIEQLEYLQTSLSDRGYTFKATTSNLVDRAWGPDKPTDPETAVQLHDLTYAGQLATAKIARIQNELRASNDAALIVTLPDNIAWLLNIRGSDIPHTPVALAFAIVPATGRPEIFFTHAKPGRQQEEYLAEIAEIFPHTSLQRQIKSYAASGGRIRIDHRTAAHWFVKQIGPNPKLVNRAPDPITAAKARKNEVELAGARLAHQRDGEAMCKFLCWFESTVETGRLDEITATRKLEDFRRETGHLRDLSFDTIAGSGPNGAIVHYRVTDASNRQFQRGDLFLIDSGGQYLDGTTDVTRTVAVEPVAEQTRKHYTLVLKGHIAIAAARFPIGTRGVDIDGFARAALWSHGLDYDHGTGHGIGSFLSVHEGPQSISRRGMAALEPGMICSNEPGYYKINAYGIRIENLCAVKPPETVEGGDRPMLSFETLTLVPYDRRLILPALLSECERAWLNAYHERVRDEISPGLDQTEREWLISATAPLS